MNETAFEADRMKLEMSAMRSRRLLFRVYVAVVVALFLIVAYRNFGSFPYMNEDEGSFFLPSWNFAVFGNLNPAILNAPDGIYWIPHGFYLFLGSLLHFFGTNIRVAAEVCAGTAALATAVMLFALARVARSHIFAGLCAIFLLSPSTIFAADTIRMESVILLLYAAALWLHMRGYVLSAASLLALSLLVHPALGFSLVLYGISVGAGLWLMPESRRFHSRISLVTGAVLLVLVLVAYAGEIHLVLEHQALFRVHMAFQSQRKSGRTIADILLHKRGLLLIAEAAFIGGIAFAAHHLKIGRAFLLELAPVGALGIGLQAFAAVGYEMPYAVYSYAIAPATLLSLAYGTVQLLEEVPNPLQLMDTRKATDGHANHGT